MLAQLVPLAGGPTITLDRDVTVVGRQREHCDLVIERKSISKMHCVVIKTDGLLFIRDLSSTNGTKVNGQRVVRGALLPGDQLEFASEKFRVFLGPDQAARAVNPGDQTEFLVGPPQRPVEEHFAGPDDSSSPDVEVIEEDIVE